MYSLLFFTRLSIISFYVITWLTGFVVPPSEMDMVLCIFVLLNYFWCLINIAIALSPPNYTKWLVFKSLIFDLIAPWLAASLLLKSFHSTTINGSSIFGLKQFWFIFGLALLWQKMIVLRADD